MHERLLTRAQAIRSTGIPEATFDRLNIEPRKREGRHVYYSVRDIVHAVLTKEAIRSDLVSPLARTSPRAAMAAVKAIADDVLR